MKKTAGEKNKGSFRRAARAGQILIPSLMVIPSLLLFVYLLFETTNLSREKIRQQFAVDSAAFIQMGDYTNLLNRTAYVNGAFPYRIFKEAFECPNPEKWLQNAVGSGQICPYDMMYAAGAFPKANNDQPRNAPVSLDGKNKWDIEFDQSVRPEFTTNPTGKKDTQLFSLVTAKQGKEVMLEFGGAIIYYQFYAKVYSLLGSVELSQYTVFDRLTQNFNFFRKSYYWNAGTKDCVAHPQNCGEDGLDGFRSISISKDKNTFFMHYIQKIDIYAKVFTGGSLPPYYIGHSDPAMDMTKMNPDGLFQLATVRSDILKKLGNPGLEVSQGWDVPSNFFNVDFTNIAKCAGMSRPCVHALITTQCPQLLTAGNNCVWPSPTPKYQTRLYP